MVEVRCRAAKNRRYRWIPVFFFLLLYDCADAGVPSTERVTQSCRMRVLLSALSLGMRESIVCTFRWRVSHAFRCADLV